MSDLNPSARPRSGLARQTILAMPALLVAMAVPATGSATPFADAAGDFLASYTGPQNGDLDIVAGSTSFTSTHVELSLIVNGAIGSLSATPYYLWGINRGNGTDRLVTSGPPAVGPSTILLDTVVRLDFDGNGRVVTFASAVSPGVVTLLDPDVVGIAGNTISARIPLSLLPSTGYAAEQYTYIAWTRSAIGSQGFIADLAPDDASILAIPEPATWALVAAGMAFTGFVVRSRRARGR